MEANELDQWAEDFVQFHARFAHLFGRKETRSQSMKYVRALLAPVERKNGWQLAEVMGDRTPDATQRLLYQAQWEADDVRDELQGLIIEHFGDEEAIGVVDETGFLKKGRHSAGVKRQYSGTAGKTENCQIGTFLSYATAAGHFFLDRRLYLPKEWCEDEPRRLQAKVPESVLFQTKPQQAMAMLTHAWEMGVPMRWVTGDAIYGESGTLREVVAASGRWYVLAVRTYTLVWLERPVLEVPAWTGFGRPPTRMQVAQDAPPVLPVIAVVAAWPDSRWQRLTVAEGEKGSRTYDWACQRIIECCDQLPSRDGWLLARRSITQPDEIAYYLSNAPADTPLLKLAQVAATRYTVEQSLEEAKGEVGLDHYEVRSWHSWYRHITLALMAHTFLALIRHKAHPQKKPVNRS
jgi:SRSO17 transposase